MFWVWVGVVGFILYYIFDFYRTVAAHPRGPPPLPLLGNLLQLTPRMFFLDFEKFAEKYGPVFTIYTPTPVVVLADYECVREAFLNQGESFVDRPGTVVNEMISYCKDGGVVQTNGENWRAQRRTAITILRDFGMGKNLMENKVKRSAQEYLNCLADIKDKSHVDMRWPLQLMIANIIHETLFGNRYKYDDCELLMNYVESANNLDAVIEQEVAHAKKDYDLEMEPECFVQAYMQKMPSNSLLTDKQLHACCNDFFLAGQETTTTTLRWAMLFLAGEQTVQDKIRSEVMSVVGGDRLPSMADRAHLPYTTAACYEIQRRANILAANFIIIRRSIEDTTVKGHSIPAGTMVYGDYHQIHRKDPLFENPEAFRPERFLLEDGRTLNKKLIEHTVPFGMGKRQCAGEGLARVEIFYGVTATLQHYRILPPLDGKIDLEPIYLNFHLPKPHELQIVPV